MRLKRIYIAKTRTFLRVCIVGVMLLLLVKGVTVSLRFMRDTGLTPATAFRLLFDSGTELKLTDGRTNILILGIGGDNHAGADLTDTMLIVSVNARKRAMALISVPRDMWSDTIKDKVNSAYHYGEEKKKGGGVVLSKAIVEDIVGLPMHYAIVIDFSGFKKVIDLVGGVRINVPQALTDTEFPIEGKEEDPCGGDPEYRCRYETLHFDAGVQLMEGERALQYVRSRHAEGDEGGDFARNRRQQELLLALKETLVSLRVWLSPTRDVAILRALDAATETDMNIGEFLTVGRLIEQIRPEKTLKVWFIDFLTNPPAWLYDGKYVLVPKEDVSTIHDYIRNQLAD